MLKATRAVSVRTAPSRTLGCNFIFLLFFGGRIHSPVILQCEIMGRISGTNLRILGEVSDVSGPARPYWQRTPPDPPTSRISSHVLLRSRRGRQQEHGSAVAQVTAEHSLPPIIEWVVGEGNAADGSQSGDDGAGLGNEPE